MRTVLCRIFRRARATILVGLAATSTLTACAGVPVGRAPSTAPALHEQTVKIPEKDLTLSGVLFASASSSGLPERHPAIVLMHGCGGMFDSRGALVARNRDWAE